MPSPTFDYLLIGQGIAGTLLHWELSLRGYSAMVIDAPRAEAASAVAAGIMNPITGRRFAKSWDYDRLYPQAASTYRALEQSLGVSFFYPKPIVRAVPDLKTYHDLQLRATEPDVAAYLQGDWQEASRAEVFIGLERAVVLKQTAQVQLEILLRAYRKWLLASHSILEEDFRHQALVLSTEGVGYTGANARHFTAKGIVFCEGAAAITNPLFAELPFRPSKGSVLLVRIPAYPYADCIIKHDLFFVHLYEELYWVGSRYDNHYSDAAPTAADIADLEDRLRKGLKIPYQILSHRAGVRPATIDRRPIVGQHPSLSNVYILNGLGTKGASLAPMMATELADYLTAGKPLNPICDIRRFASLLSGE